MRRELPRGTWMFIGGLLCAAACGRVDFSSVPDGAGSNDGSGGAPLVGFPRLAGLDLQDPQTYDALSFREAAAKRQLVVMSYYPGWQVGRSMTLEQVVTDVKARSTVGTKLFVYINNDDEFLNPVDSGDQEYPVWQKLNAEHWWLYPSGTSGTPVTNNADPGYSACNTSAFAPADATGKTWADVNAEFNYAFTIVGDASNDPTPDLDGFLLGNVQGSPQYTGDWNRDGTVDADNPALDAALQAGGREYLDHLHAIWPSGLALAAMYGWIPPIGVLDQGANGGDVGPLIGESYSDELDLGFDVMMAHYAASLDAAAPPKLVTFTQDNWVAGDYQSMRYGLGACLMDDGYFDIKDSVQSLVSDALWFDEFDFQLGQPLQSRQTSAWSQGVWRRDFEHGIVLVNPRGNGMQTVELGGTFMRLTGTQDPVANSGAAVTSVTLAERDGLVLSR